MGAFDITRPLVASGAVGVAQRALAEAAKYAQDRKTFGVPIISHQAIGTLLAEMAISVECARNAVWRASLAKDHEDPKTTYFASIAKAFASQAAIANADKCVQVFGGAVRPGFFAFLKLDGPVRLRRHGSDSFCERALGRDTGLQYRVSGREALPVRRLSHYVSAPVGCEVVRDQDRWGT